MSVLRMPLGTLIGSVACCSLAIGMDRARTATGVDQAVTEFKVTGKGVLVAIFEGNELHFLRAGELLARAAELSSTSVDELFRRHGTGESRTAQSMPPLPLPPGRQ